MTGRILTTKIWEDTEFRIFLLFFSKFALVKLDPLDTLCRQIRKGKRSRRIWSGSGMCSWWSGSRQSGGFLGLWFVRPVNISPDPLVSKLNLFRSCSSSLKDKNVKVARDHLSVYETINTEWKLFLQSYSVQIYHFYR